MASPPASRMNYLENSRDLWESTWLRANVRDVKWKQPCSGFRAKKAEQAFDLASDLPGHCPDYVPDSKYTNYYQ